MKIRYVWTEISQQGSIIRIFKSRSAAVQAGVEILWVPKSLAIGSIRHQLFVRCAGECEICAAPLTEESGNMHEKKHRGKGGEISLANSVFICPTCHSRAHADRNPRFTKNPLTSESTSGTL